MELDCYLHADPGLIDSSERRGRNVSVTSCARRAAHEFLLEENNHLLIRRQEEESGLVGSCHSELFDWLHGPFIAAIAICPLSSLIAMASLAALASFLLNTQSYILLFASFFFLEYSINSVFLYICSIKKKIPSDSARNPV